VWQLLPQLLGLTHLLPALLLLLLHSRELALVQAQLPLLQHLL
jgi:hypothetical protein